MKRRKCNKDINLEDLIRKFFKLKAKILSEKEDNNVYNFVDLICLSNKTEEELLCELLGVDSCKDIKSLINGTFFNYSARELSLFTLYLLKETNSIEYYLERTRR